MQALVKEQLELELKVYPAGRKALENLTVEEIYARADAYLLAALAEDRRIEKKSARVATRQLDLRGARLFIRVVESKIDLRRDSRGV